MDSPATPNEVGLEGASVATAIGALALEDQVEGLCLCPVAVDIIDGGTCAYMSARLLRPQEALLEHLSHQARVDIVVDGNAGPAKGAAHRWRFSGREAADDLTKALADAMPAEGVTTLGCNRVDESVLTDGTLEGLSGDEHVGRDLALQVHGSYRGSADEEQAK